METGLQIIAMLMAVITLVMIGLGMLVSTLTRSKLFSFLTATLALATTVAYAFNAALHFGRNAGTYLVFWGTVTLIFFAWAIWDTTDEAAEEPGVDA